uniref:Mitochondrial ribosome-associated GTPase 2 n=1 Tax=Eptatretus burgeri TaxID=7764 RepID=A0A8C4WXM3_EPTBU
MASLGRLIGVGCNYLPAAASIKQMPLRLCCKLHGSTQPKMGRIQTVKRKPNLTEKQLSKYFVDEREVLVCGGLGADGACCFHSEPEKERGGPDGGNGGSGGHVIFQVDVNTRSLVGLPSICRAHDGQSGKAANCHGRNGQNFIVKVPAGTFVQENDELVVSLEEHGVQWVAARGGAGGLGNHAFLCNELRAPLSATPGRKGQERHLLLELRVMANAGLVGLPNAGKSTLLGTISKARPAVGAYPFTTLRPHVGVITFQDHSQVSGQSNHFLNLYFVLPTSYTHPTPSFPHPYVICVDVTFLSVFIPVADLPGIIKDAHLGRGLGLSFLRHIERCKCLLFTIDLSASDPLHQLSQLRTELAKYRPELAHRPQMIIGTKLDMTCARMAAKQLYSCLGNQPFIPLSAHTGENVHVLLDFLQTLVER